MCVKKLCKGSVTQFLDSLQKQKSITAILDASLRNAPAKPSALAGNNCSAETAGTGIPQTQSSTSKIMSMTVSADIQSISGLPCQGFRLREIR